MNLESAIKITICYKCRHHRNIWPGGPAGPPSNEWYYQLCAHPEMERPLGVDPVTGEECYWLKNDLGTTVPVSEPHPYCRDINDGHCARFEEK